MNTALQDALIGSVVLGRYRVMSPLARGGMGVVYLGRLQGSAGFSRPVVIKRLIPGLVTDARVSALFVREARILSNLHHPGIVGVLDFGEEDDAHVMVLEYVNGYDLAQWLQFVRKTQRKVPLQHATHILLRVLDGLHYAHTLCDASGRELGIVHRDISPSNILLDVQGYVRLHDFGVARLTSERTVGPTDTSFKGKVTYTAPEVFAGSGATARSDLFSCGVVLYEMISGTNPFRAPTIAESLQRVMTWNASDVRKHLPSLPHEMTAVLMRALAANPERRFASAAEFAEALRAARSDPEDVVAAEFARVVADDFTGGLPSALKLPSLAQRQQLWRSEPDETQLALTQATPTPQKTRPAAADDVTVADPPVKRAARRRPVAVLASAVVAALVGVGVYAGKTQSAPASAGAPQFVVIEQKRAPSALAQPASAPEPPQAPSATAVVPSASAPAPSPTATTTGRAPPSGNGLSRALQQEQRRIERCFEQHAAELEGQPQITLRFEVAANGAVQRASLGPQALATTALGQCILAIARTVSFPAQGEAVAFSVPLTARKR
jgi:serine/threonine-protein kinase